MATYTIRREPTDEPRYQIDYAAELNEAQLEAATTLEGPVLVVAGAGSGKTRTLTYRVARLVESGVDPRHILLLTFTRRAAQEMLRRAERLATRAHRSLLRQLILGCFADPRLLRGSCSTACSVAAATSSIRTSTASSRTWR